MNSEKFIFFDEIYKKKKKYDIISSLTVEDQKYLTSPLFMVLCEVLKLCVPILFFYLCKNFFKIFI